MEKQRLLMGVSGVRGVVGESLTEGIVSRLVRSWAETIRGPVVLGRDSRPSGPRLATVARRELLETGHPIYEVGVVPTPTLGRAVRRFGAAAGLQITASHNPPEWNGVKFFTAQGRTLPPAEGTGLLERFRVAINQSSSEEDYAELHHTQLPASNHPAANSDYPERALQDHIETVLACVETEAIRRRHFRVLLDANGGAGGPLGVRLLEALGCQVVPLHCEPDGLFRHEPEPTPASLQQVAPLVAQCACDLGLALDTDADRLVLMDEMGRCLSEELTLALAVEARLRQQPGPIVTNLSTSMVVEQLCQRRGLVCYLTPVGEAHVVDGMLRYGAVLGGEGNGGVIDPRVGLVRDPFIGSALILQLLAELGKTLSAVVASLPNLVLRREKVPLDPESWPEVRKRLLAAIPAPCTDQRDGLYFRWPDRWLHVRPSNTEPILRIIAETPRESDTDTLINLAQRIVINR